MSKNLTPEEEKQLEFIYGFNRLLDKMVEKTLDSKSIIIQLDSGATTEITEDNLDRFD